MKITGTFYSRNLVRQHNIFISPGIGIRDNFKREKTDGSYGKIFQAIRQFTEEVTVYPVSCEKLAAGKTDRDWLDRVLAGGARIVQLRDKQSRILIF